MIPHCLTLSNIRYVSRVKGNNPGKGVAPSPTPRCSSYWKGRLLVGLDYGRQLYFTYNGINLCVWRSCAVTVFNTRLTYFDRSVLQPSPDKKVLLICTSLQSPANQFNAYFKFCNHVFADLNVKTSKFPKINFTFYPPCRWDLEYTDYIPPHIGVRTRTHTYILGITVNLMVRLQFRRSGEYGVPLHYHYTKSRMIVSVRVTSMVQIDLSKNYRYSSGA